MDKIEKIEKGRDFALEMAKKFHCENYLTDSVPSTQEQTIKLRSFLFDRLKQEISLNLSVLDAYFTAANNLLDEDDCIFIFEGLQDILTVIVKFKTDYQTSLCEEEEEEVTDGDVPF